MALIVGSLTYRQRIALQPGGVAIIALTPRSTGEMLESDVRQWRFDLHDRQVPIQFELEVPIDIATDSANVELSAWIDDAEGVRLFFHVVSRTGRVRRRASRCRHRGVENG